MPLSGTAEVGRDDGPPRFTRTMTTPRLRVSLSIGCGKGVVSRGRKPGISQAFRVSAVGPVNRW